ncbi:hypothetical protein predicted by Glimmer/Critica [Bdellovibrio bacteriovorus HD100]|uniref:Uncharacterized protein n=1 Tax=Bdellovibrio bacteriovorus (strain ATCC 15356 / DSM 50701 / NCIMB 9529 / HD100) TaxID=264462 RepID=Q6MQ16_BDEBA|nr:hypothetical protein predicted by Glimmer/Critica [Bdellovibrio bacteriovorus HD100]
MGKCPFQFAAQKQPPQTRLEPYYSFKAYILSVYAIYFCMWRH